MVSSVMNNANFAVAQQRLDVARSTYYIYLLKKWSIFLTTSDSYIAPQNAGSSVFLYGQETMADVTTPIIGGQNVGYTTTTQTSYKANLTQYAQTVALSANAVHTLSCEGGIKSEQDRIIEAQILAINQGMETIFGRTYFSEVEQDMEASPNATTGAIGTISGADMLRAYMILRKNDAITFEGFVPASKNIGTAGAIGHSYLAIVHTDASPTMISDTTFTPAENYGDVNQTYTYTEYGTYRGGKVRVNTSNNTSLEKNSSGLYPMAIFARQHTIKCGIEGQSGNVGSGLDGEGGALKSYSDRITPENARINAVPLTPKMSESYLEKPDNSNPQMAVKWMSCVSTYFGAGVLRSENSIHMLTKLSS